MGRDAAGRSRAAGVTAGKMELPGGAATSVRGRWGRDVSEWAEAVSWAGRACGGERRVSWAAGSAR